jgi:hypothetical protein
MPASIGISQNRKKQRKKDRRKNRIIMVSAKTIIFYLISRSIHFLSWQKSRAQR